MAATPPPLPSATLARVIRLATLDGRFLLFIAGLFALLAAVSRDGLGAIAGCFAAGAGAMELHGVSLLRQRLATGVDWLVRSQLLLLGTVLLYCAARLMSFDVAAINAVMTDDMRQQLSALDLSPAELRQFLERIYQATYIIVGVVTFFYQGGLAIYYHRRRSVIGRAIAE